LEKPRNTVPWCLRALFRGNSWGWGRNRIGRREKWPKKTWEEEEIGGKSWEEGENLR